MHPFDSLAPDEISRSAAIVRPHFGQRPINFRVVTLQEPPKQQMIAFLERGASRPARCARVEVVTKLPEEKNALFELLVDLDGQKVIAKQHQRGKHSYIDAAYMQQVEAACLANEEVKRQIEVLNLPEGSSVVVEPWAYATDGENDMSQRVSMVSTCRFCHDGKHRMLNLFSAGSISDWVRTKTSTTMHTLSTCAQRCRKTWNCSKFIAYRCHPANASTTSSVNSTAKGSTPLPPANTTLISDHLHGLQRSRTR